MTNQEKLALIEEILELDEGTLTPEMELDEIESYDSMAKLSVIVMLDDEFGRKITGAEIKGFKTVADMMALMEEV